MKRVRLLTVFLAITLLAASASFAQSWAGRGRLQGTVQGPDGKPLVGAKVTLMKDGVEGEGPAPLETNKKGKWSILGLGGGNWTAVIEYDGLIPGEGSVRVSEFGSGPSINVTLREIPKEVLEQAEAESGVGRVDEGNRLLEEGKYAEARAAYQEAIEKLDESNHPALLRGIARTYFQEGDVDQAVATLEKNLELVPDDTDSLRLIINLLVAADREADAQVFMARLPEGSTVDSNTLLNIGIKAYNDNDIPGALETFDRVVAENPELADAYYFRGLCHMNNGSNAEAKADFDKLLEIAPDHGKADEVKQFAEYLATQL